MGGCRCSYKNCTQRTDGKTHMFHYPVFDKVRCHQWLTNAHKLEFLNLKVSQLKNRVVCQHHFKDDCFMNYKKEKLTFEAVPTEDGPYCNSSNLDDKKSEQDDIKAFSISLDDIENEYLNFTDKKANFSVKYGDFLTNCELMDLDSLNQINDNNQIVMKNLSVLDSLPNISKYESLASEPVRNVHSKMQIASKKPSLYKPKKINMHNNSIKVNLVKPTLLDTQELQKGKANHQKNGTTGSTNFTLLNNTQEIHKEIVENNTETDNYLTNPTQQINDGSVMNQKKDDYSTNLTINVSLVPVEFDETKPFDQNQQNIGRSTHVIDFKESNNDPNKSNTSVSASPLKERKKIRIISEKKIFNPIRVTKKLEPVSHDKVLPLPKKCSKLFQNKNDAATTNNKEIPIAKMQILSKDSILVKNPTPIQIDSCGQKKYFPQQNTSSLLIQKPAPEIDSCTEIKYSPQKNTDSLVNEMPNEELPNTPLSNPSLIKMNVPPERKAAIAEKRKFNMKLRDIIENCLDKLDSEPDKIDLHQRKSPRKTNTLNSQKQEVVSYLAKDSELPIVQDYTIAFLEARMKKMENNLLNKIDENSKKISELKNTFAPPIKKKTACTQTSVSEEAHKRQLYQEISTYLSQQANSLIYEELFINKYTQDVPPSSPSRKRRKRRY